MVGVCNFVRKRRHRLSMGNFNIMKGHILAASLPGPVARKVRENAKHRGMSISGYLSRIIENAIYDSSSEEGNGRGLAETMNIMRDRELYEKILRRKVEPIEECKSLEHVLKEIEAEKSSLPNG